MQNVFIAGAGGFIGTVLRYLLNTVIYNSLNYPIFPFGTLIINISGCFLIGLFASLAETRLVLTPEVRIFLQIGVLGGFTTFSAFGYETFTLLKSGQFLLAASNVLIQVIIGMCAVGVGYYLGQ